MLIDYKSNKSATKYSYDFCIIGSGVAGTVLANELARNLPKKSIAVLESGDWSLENEHNRTIKKCNTKNFPLKEDSRELAIGGTSNTWGGLNTHFLPIEIEQRPFLEKSEWPIPYSELEEYYKKASEKYKFDDTLGKDEKIRNSFAPFSKRLFKARLPANNFKDFCSAEKFDLIYNAHAIGFGQKDSRVEYVRISNVATEVVSTVRADYFILASGCLETVKLLLNSLKRNEIILDKEEKFIGHYFMNHPKGQFGLLELYEDTLDMENYVGGVDDGVVSYYGLSLAPEKQMDYGLLNSYIRFSPRVPWAGDPLVTRLILFLRSSKAFLKGVIQSNRNKRIELLDFAETGDPDALSLTRKEGNIFRSLSNIAKYIFYRSLNKKPTTKEYYIHNYLEMEPCYSNSIYLSHATDELGQYDVIVDYSLSRRDYKSIKTLHQDLKEFVSTSQIGKVWSNIEGCQEWPIKTDASHHLGGAVMGFSSEDSVTDANLKVHSLSNLFIVGGAVFPTSGSGNPTWTIAALALRLAKHLEEKN